MCLAMDTADSPPLSASPTSPARNAETATRSNARAESWRDEENEGESSDDDDEEEEEEEEEEDRACFVVSRGEPFPSTGAGASTRCSAIVHSASVAKPRGGEAEGESEAQKANVGWTEHREGKGREGKGL